jgi:hypothetical protein
MPPTNILYPLPMTPTLRDRLGARAAGPRVQSLLGARTSGPCVRSLGARASGPCVQSLLGAQAAGPRVQSLLGARTSGPCVRWATRTHRLAHPHPIALPHPSKRGGGGTQTSQYHDGHDRQGSGSAL